MGVMFLHNNSHPNTGKQNYCLDDEFKMTVMQGLSNQLANSLWMDTKAGPKIL